EALDIGAEKLVIGLGGSATNDAGAGILVALGACLTDKQGRELAPGGKPLSDLTNIDLCDLDERLARVNIQVACDVKNPLYGPEGASQIFGPQKGASPEQVGQLDRALTNFADSVFRDRGVELQPIVGGGAAGGIAATLSGLLSAQLVSGIDLVLSLLNFDQVIRDADWVITGEGRVDGQTLGGKTLAGVGHRAMQAGVPVIALAGEVTGSTDLLRQAGINAVFSITSGPGSLEKALAGGHDNLVRTSSNLAAIIKAASTITR
ncbi:MAG: glycerate kinase, partial [Natronospirillum sp.]